MSSTPRGRRPRDAAPPTDEQLIAWFQAGELLDRITRYFDLANPDDFRAAARQAGALAASGEMDLLSFIESGAVAAVERHDFFVVMQFYIQAIPNMVEPVPRMLAAVDALVTIGGSDGAATWPYDALVEWLQNDPPRAEQIIAGAGAGDALADANLTFGLQVVADPARARAFLASPDPKLKASALTALARIPDGDPVSRATSIQAIESALGDGADDMLCANGIAAILAIASHEPFADHDLVLSAIGVALAARGDGTLYRATAALWTNAAARRPEIAPSILKALLDLNPEHKGTTDTLDLGLKALIDAGHDEAVLQFLADLLVKNRGQLKAGAFNSVWEEIVSGPPDRLTRWIITWLLAGEIALGFAVSEVLAHLERDGTGLTVDRTQLPATAADLGYLARKAVGWFMLQPHLATSLLVAVLGICDTPTARNVAGLLAHPSSAVSTCRASGVRTRSRSSSCGEGFTQADFVIACMARSCRAGRISSLPAAVRLSLCMDASGTVTIVRCSGFPARERNSGPAKSKRTGSATALPSRLCDLTTGGC